MHTVLFTYFPTTLMKQSTTPRVCVIGAGCSGITALKNLLQAGVTDVVCYEQNSEVGGNWIFTAGESHSSVCETTHIISSKTLSGYMDFPMPEDYPDYPSHDQVLAYFQSYARHFNLHPYIQFNTTVQSAVKHPDESWEITLDNGSVERFDYLFVANGHHSVPRMPQLPGVFEGEFLHSHSYKSSNPYRGKKVLVIGAGNSGCDCAVEISRVAEHVGISIRSPKYIVPKFFLGKPTDTFNEVMSFLPKPLLRFLQKISLKIQIGSYESYGLKTPDYPVVKSHPTLNSELLYKIRHGKVHPRKGISKVSGHEVTFTDGTTESYDVLLAATGYKITFPFFDADFLDYSEADRIPLYLRMFHPNHPSLVLIGLFQPQGAIWPLSDYQAKLAANYVMGRWQMPQNVETLAEADSDFIEREFIKSKRHTIEVHYHPFLRTLARQIPKGAPEWSGVPSQAVHS
ncbi:NAD(P)-binding domain-containing protein [Pontibacter sp. G13]|uniref:flavin-containing monooxygenase n=1 Tax=Pontibacter sp. G13 TaxID=3074898 RepID=UPI002889DE17|nr:NAD(P)-binding domain-containing protein [Pontibacter sp. G13]WNJ20284.1 NAD(P)-binding domain-containing protein [Pontibacter sp. G13]